MKYAITGPAGRIFNVLNESTPDSTEITEQQAIIINASTAPIFLIAGQLKTQAEMRVIRQAQKKAELRAAMTPEQLAAAQQLEAAQAAYATALAAFNTLSLGKQALWQTVRDKVGEAILAGRIDIAIEILQTTPVIYQGAEADRDIFLSLFE